MKYLVAKSLNILIFNVHFLADDIAMSMSLELSKIHSLAPSPGPKTRTITAHALSQANAWSALSVRSSHPQFTSRQLCLSLLNAVSMFGQ